MKHRGYVKAWTATHGVVKASDPDVPGDIIVLPALLRQLGLPDRLLIGQPVMFECLKLEEDLIATDIEVLEFKIRRPDHAT